MQVLGTVQDPCLQPVKQIGVLQSAPVHPERQTAQLAPDDVAEQVQLFGDEHKPLIQAGEQTGVKQSDPCQPLQHDF